MALFDLYVDREDHYIQLENATDQICNRDTCRLMCYAKKGGYVMFMLDRYIPQVSAECTIYGVGNWASKAIFRHFANFAFKDLACQRLTCVAKETNKKSVALNKRLGMIKEGVLQRATIDGEAVGIWGYFPENCKYLR